MPRQNRSFDLFSALIALIITAAFILATLTTMRDCRHRAYVESVRSP